jgi:hypothetical protein
MTDEPMTQEERAVIEAAEAYMKLELEGYYATAGALIDLRKAIDALIASRRPKGVKPEEVALSERSGLVRAIPEEEYQRLLRIIDRLTELLLAVQQKDK